LLASMNVPDSSTYVDLHISGLMLSDQ
jgi:hypothetical protein